MGEKMNLVAITGSLGRDVEMRTTQTGKQVANFSVAVSDGWGENKRTEWINIVAWDKLAELCSNYLHKGSKVLVVGKYQSRQWEDKDGNKRTAVDVVARDIEFLSPKHDEQKNYSGSTGDDVPIDDGSVPF
jgi:single-strand DNA-binding protein